MIRFTLVFPWDFCYTIGNAGVKYLCKHTEGVLWMAAWLAARGNKLVVYYKRISYIMQRKERE